MVTGIAWGMDLIDADSIVAAYLGDGATSTGASHEAINFAGVLDVPAVFFCQNNQWAISTPFEKQTNANTLAQRALGYGLDGIRVDGMDVLAVFEGMSAARERASNGRPVFVESLCYRLDAHTTSDDPSRYRDEADTEPWEERDPIERYRRFLESEGLWERIDDESIVESIDEEFDAALDAANAFEERGVGEVFEHVYDELPPVLARQLEKVRQFFEEHPEAYDHVVQRPKG
jgi:pyruvate dehydrogenase E1 component alpha subunit